MKPLTQNCTDTLVDLYRTTEGDPSIYLEVKNCHHNTLYALKRRQLIDLRTADGVRYAALTELGHTLAAGTESTGIMPGSRIIRFEPVDTRNRITIQGQLNMDRAEHRDTQARITRLKKKREFVPTLVRSLALDEQLRSGDLTMLETEYPAAWIAIRHMIENAIHSSYVKHIENIDQLLAKAQANAMPSRPAAPVEAEGDDLQVDLQVKQAKGDSQAALNFLDSMNALNPTTKPKPAGVKQLNVQPLPPPQFDDDDDFFVAAVGD